MVRAIDNQNEQIINYMMSSDISMHLGENCHPTLGVSCRSINGQNKIIDVETMLLKSAASHAVVNESTVQELPVQRPSDSKPLPFSVGHWELRDGKSVNTVSLKANTRLVDPLPDSHPSVQERVGDPIQFFGIDSRQLIKYN